MTNYRSLTGGFFSSTPYDKSMKVSIRTNNPGAVNGATWEESIPGYVTTVETTPGNKTTIFESPEEGVAAWWLLMQRYRNSPTPATTIKQIITRYGGTSQDYSSYATMVVKWSGLPLDFDVKLAGDDPNLLKFAKSMFRYEAGEPTPLSDQQILYGFNLARKGSIPEAPKQPQKGLFAIIWDIIKIILGVIFGGHIGRKPNADPVPHLTVMRKITGTKEVPGPGDNPFIVHDMTETIAKAFPAMSEYAHQYTHDSIPWCGQCVAYCLAANGLKPVFGKTDTDKYLWAAAWAKEGPELIKLDKLFPGAIMVFTRDGGGHVSLYEGEDDDYYYIRGGNQSDAVNVVRKSKSAFTAATWPRALPIPNLGPVLMNASGNPLSGSEQ